jgi:hypothetical protein
MTITETADFYGELTTRNSGFIPAATQARLRRARILVAGCGSTGGAAVEPLTRLGVQHFILADNGDYELNNLNRQHAQLADIGRNKAVVSAELVRAINPLADVEVRSNGIEADTVDALVARCAVVVDGVDVTEKSGMSAKLALHASAARLRVPVISGYDMAGMQFVRCYDYRTPRPPLDGAITGADIESSTSWRLLDRLIPRRRVPVEMIRSLRGSLNDPDYHVSQLVYTSLLFGAITSRMSVEIIGGNRVRRQVAIDVHRAVRRPWANLRLSASKPVEVLRILRSL